MHEKPTRLSLEHLTVESFEAQPHDPSAPGAPRFNWPMAPTYWESCGADTCNACTFTCYGCMGY